MIKLGIVSLESTHVDAFYRILNSDPWEPSHLDGAQVVALCSQDDLPERIEQLRLAQNPAYRPDALCRVVSSSELSGTFGTVAKILSGEGRNPGP